MSPLGFGSTQTAEPPIFSVCRPICAVGRRYKLTMLKGLETSYLQLNVYNLFDEFYVGGFTGGLNQANSSSGYGNPPNVQIGAPRTISGTLSIGF